jgi:hypothetical protein
MPFSNYRDNYDAATLAILQAAFDEAWEVLTTSGGASTKRPRGLPWPTSDRAAAR